MDECQRSYNVRIMVFNNVITSLFVARATIGN
jgi:hypothetical protein